MPNDSQVFTPWICSQALPSLLYEASNLLNTAVGDAEAVPSVNSNLLLKKQKMPPRSFVSIRHCVVKVGSQNSRLKTIFHEWAVFLSTQHILVFLGPSCCGKAQKWQIPNRKRAMWIHPQLRLWWIICCRQREKRSGNLPACTRSSQCTWPHCVSPNRLHALLNSHSGREFFLKSVNLVSLIIQSYHPNCQNNIRNIGNRWLF